MKNNESVMKNGMREENNREDNVTNEDNEWNENMWKK